VRPENDRRHEIAKVYQPSAARMTRTCELSGFAREYNCRDLVEWDYGKYEGLTSAEILKQN
jgi:probable phosphoglycerate mutase